MTNKNSQTPILDKIELEIRKSNEKMHSLNMNPSISNYDEKYNKIRTELESRLSNILLNK